MLIGEVLGRAAGVAFLARKIDFTKLPINWKNSHRINLLPKSIIALNFFTIFLEMLLSSIILIYTLAIFGHSMAGQYALATKIMSLPLALIGTVVSQVVLSKSSASLREGRLLSKHQFSKILLALFSVGLMISCVIYFSALYVMPFLVGSEWVEAGEILRLIAPFLLITFIWNSVSSLFYARKLWKSFFVVTLIRLMALILGAIASYELELIFSHTLLTIMFFGVLAQLSAIFFLFHGLSNLPKEKLTKKP